MRAPFFSLAFLLFANVSASFAAFADSSKTVAAYDAILAGVTPGQTTIPLGDMIVPVATVRLWRDQLAGTAAPSSASQTGVSKWTGGIVYYAFDASVIENATVKHRTATLDAMAEWATFANLTFIPRVAQANYILIKDVPGLGGGVAALGMAGGAQQFDIGSNAWNRGTLIHELGHTLGLIHEHQRSDRDTFVTINFSNVPGGLGDGNFIRIPTSTNNGLYDFLSVMHYARKTLAVNPAIDTITPNAGYTQFIDIMGNNPDRVLSRGDRNGIAMMYMPAPVLTTVVTNTKDSGIGSLRAAIYKAFDIATDTPGATPAITFQIPNTDPNFSGGVFTIQPSDRMTAPGSGTTIDATTQTAFTGNTNAGGPEVVLNGALQPAPEFYTSGLRLSAANVTVKGLVINGFSTYGVLLAGSATGSTLAGCYIGTNAAGTAAVPNGFAGVQFEIGATGNRIGGTTAAARNVISGQTYSGIGMTGDTTAGNFIEGNYIGTNAAGTAALANGSEGITLDGSRNNTIGGTSAGARNVISGNTYRGVVLGDGARGNVVAGNFIGVTAAGTAALPNQAGIYVLGTENMIGGTAVGAGNVISGNTYQGVFIGDLGSDGNVVAGNLIGLNAAGTAAVANGYAGVQIAGGVQNNLIGGMTAGARNVISGNSNQGILISSDGTPTKNNIIAGNFIGLNSGGAAAIPNAFAGIEISGGSRSNTVGGTAPGAGNVISGNTSQGVFIRGTGTISNVVAGNFIGLNAAGTAAVANGFSGIEIGGGAQINSVGGTTAAARNVISGNAIQGAYLNGAGTNNNSVLGNYIGTNPAGTAAVPNAGDGVEIWNGPTGSVVGGTAPGAGNVISGNANRNVLIIAANNNTVAGNFIGLNAAGTAALVNGGPGVQMWGGASGNTIGGTSGGRNFISGNTNEGLTISDSGTNANIIVGNSIGLAPGGAIVANSGNGISIFGGPQNNVIGGSTVGAANSISGNNGAGIAIYNASTGNRISGNSITGNGNSGLGIDFWNDGVTGNDANDGDTGPNNLQNFPVLNSAVLGTGTTISWTLNSTPNTTFRVEFFANASNDGEGQTFIGAASVSTIASGNPAVTPISTTLPAIVPANYYITATATDAAGNTSEFSAHRQVSTTDSEPDGLPDAYEIATWTNLTSATGAGDSDGDGMTNAQEFRAGTNPRDPLSLFRLAPPATVGADKTLSLANFAGRTCRIDFTDLLGSPTPWRILADQIPGTGSTITVTDPGAAALPQRFYRAVVEP